MEKVAFGSDEDREALGAVLERGYIDLVLLNGFVVNGEYVFLIRNYMWRIFRRKQSCCVI